MTIIFFLCPIFALFYFLFHISDSYDSCKPAKKWDYDK